MTGKLILSLRLKPSLSSTADTSYYRLNSSTEIQLLVPPNNREPYNFKEISSETNDTIIKSLSKSCAEAVLGGTSISVVAIGAKGSGKTHTIFGDSTGEGIKQSLSYSVVQELFESIKNTPKEKNCSFTVSFIEVDNEIVRDLGTPYYKRDELRMNQIVKLMATQNLEIREVSGRSYVEDACILQVISPDEVIDIINFGFKAKEALHSRGDSIFCITLSQRIKNDIQSARIYLVDFSSSSSLDFTDASPMTCMKNVLNKVNLANLNVQVKNIPFKSSKLTFLLQGGFINSLINLVFHIDTDPQKFRDSYEILNYTKSILEIDKKIHMAMAVMMARPSSSKSKDWARRLKEEITDLNLNIKKSQTLYEEKIRNFSKLLNIEEDLELLVLAEKGTKEYEFCRKYREAVESVKNLNARNNELEIKAENTKKVMADLQIDYNNTAEKNRKKILELKYQIIEAKEEIDLYEERKEKTMAEKVMSSTGDLEKKLYQSHLVLEDQSIGIQSLKTQMENNSNDLRRIIDDKEATKSELENEYKKIIMQKDYEHKLNIKAIEEEFRPLIKAKDGEILKNNFMYAQKVRDLNDKFKELQAEAVSLFEIARLQGKAIYDIEKGRFNKGISPVIIPKSHVPPIPNESKFPMIFAALGSQALEIARVSSKSRSKVIVNSVKSNSTINKISIKEPEKPVVEPEPSISTLLETPLDKIKLLEIRPIGTQLQKIIKKNAKKISDIYLEKKQKESEINSLENKISEILSQKNKYQELYAKEVRKRMDKADMEREIYENQAFITELFTRPGTQRNIDMGSKMMRNIHTTVSGHRLPQCTSPSLKFQEIRPSTTAPLFMKKFRSERGLN
jgi:Kinesin motor domain